MRKKATQNWPLEKDQDKNYLQKNQEKMGGRQKKNENKGHITVCGNKRMNQSSIGLKTTKLMQKSLDLKKKSYQP